MEAVIAIGLAGNIVQFVDFGFRLFSKANEIRRKGATEHHVDLDAIAADLDALSQQLRESLRAHDESLALDEADQSLENVATFAIDLANELRSTLQNLRLEPDKSRWNSFAHALRITRNEDRLNHFFQRLMALRDQLEIRVLYKMRKEMSYNRVSQDEHFVQLGVGVQNAIKEILDGRQLFQVTLEDHTLQLLSEHKVSRDLAEAHHRDLLAAIQQKGNESEQSRILQARRLSPEALEELRESKRPVAISKLLDALYFRQKYQREDDVARAHGNTFSWIFEWSDAGRSIKEQQLSSTSMGKTGAGLSPQAHCPPDTSVGENGFVQWLKFGHGCYWINGKAGSGKSTLMKHINQHSDLERHLQVWAGSRKLYRPAFFFWNSGTDLQKTQEGLLRSLLHSVLQKDRALVAVCFPHIIDEALSKIEAAEDRPSLPVVEYRDLKMAFTKLVKFDASKTCLCLLIDGVDEYDGDVHEVCELFRATAGSRHVKILLSSRPVPECVEAFQACPGFKLQDLTRPDIQAYVEDMLGKHSRIQALKDNDPLATHKLIDAISERASGVFLWVILVTRSLLSGLSNFDTLEELQSQLESYPRELHGLYKHMLGNLNPLYRSQASRLLQLVHSRLTLRSNRVLTTLQLSFDDEEPIQALRIKQKPLEQHEKVKRCTAMEGRIRSRCCGLVEVVAPRGEVADSGFQASIQKLATYTQRSFSKDDIVRSEVQFLHKTVVDFLSDTDIWSFVLSLCDDKTFEVNTSLTAACISRIKTLPSESRIRVGSSEIMRLAKDCLFYAQRSEVILRKPQTLYLKELDRAMCLHWSQATLWTWLQPRGDYEINPQFTHIVDPSNASRIGTHWNDACGSWTVAIEYPGRTANHIENFLSLAISRNLLLYVEDVLKVDSKNVTGSALGDQWLRQVVRSFASGYYKDFEKLLLMLELLFRMGAKPSGSLATDTSPWTDTMLYLIVPLESLDKYSIEKWGRILDVFTKAGADINLPLNINGRELTLLASLEASSLKNIVDDRTLKDEANDDYYRVGCGHFQCAWCDECQLPGRSSRAITYAWEALLQNLKSHGAVSKTWTNVLRHNEATAAQSSAHNHDLDPSLDISSAHQTDSSRTLVTQLPIISVSSHAGHTFPAPLTEAAPDFPEPTRVDVEPSSVNSTAALSSLSRLTTSLSPTTSPVLQQRDKRGRAKDRLTDDLSVVAPTPGRSRSRSFRDVFSSIRRSRSVNAA